jgi:carbon starvation protein CstA
MFTFLGAIALLIIGYYTYGRVVEKVFGANDKIKTPAITQPDGLDFVPMPWWKGNLIQLLNIAGTGPVFGAITGAIYGPVAFLWIVFGCIFAGAVHDYLSGMISVRNKGIQFPEMVGKYLGKVMKTFLFIVSLVLMILVAAYFTTAPSSLLVELGIPGLSLGVATIIVFLYFILAAVLPINQVIGRIYPIFGVILLVTALAIGVMLIVRGYNLPEVTLQNLNPKGPDNAPLWPLLFITIGCGAISGFHATQSPIVSKTMKKESDGRKIFYGAMITEGVIALIWCAGSIAFFNGVGGETGLDANFTAQGPAKIVALMSNTLLGPILGAIAIIGVIILPITTGDTALRSTRMMITDLMKGYKKKDSWQVALVVTLILCIPTYFLSQMQDLAMLWRYVGGTNAIVATIMLWTGTAYLIRNNRFHWISGLPAIFMTFTVPTYWMMAEEGFKLPFPTARIIGISIASVITLWYLYNATFRRKSLTHVELLPIDA